MFSKSHDYRITEDSYTEKRPRRLLLFSAVLLPLLMATKIFIFFHPPVCFSKAPALTVVPTDIDELSFLPADVT